MDVEAQLTQLLDDEQCTAKFAQLMVELQLDPNGKAVPVSADVWKSYAKLIRAGERRDQEHGVPEIVHEDVCVGVVRDLCSKKRGRYKYTRDQMMTFLRSIKDAGKRQALLISVMPVAMVFGFNEWTESLTDDQREAIMSSLMEAAAATVTPKELVGFLRTHYADEDLATVLDDK
jgi:hypothetical protein